MTIVKENCYNNCRGHYIDNYITKYIHAVEEALGRPKVLKNKINLTSRTMKLERKHRKNKKISAFLNRKNKMKKICIKPRPPEEN